MFERRSCVRLVVSLAFLFVLLGPVGVRVQPASADSYFIVDTENDLDFFGNDHLSLREAIHAANGDAGYICTWGDGEQDLLVGCSFLDNCIIGGCGPGSYDNIRFGNAVNQVRLYSALPPLVDDGTWIDGINAGGSRVTIGAYPDAFTTGSTFDLQGANQTISNLTIVNGVHADVRVSSTAQGARIAFNYLGVRPGDAGCFASGVTRASANGVWVRGSFSPTCHDRAFIYGNVIGCHWSGIMIESDAAGFDEVYVGYEPDKTTARRNWIGVSDTGASIPNAGDGIYFSSSAQNNSAVGNNTIRNNGGSGVVIEGTGLGSGFGIFIRYNDIYSNSKLPIDLGNNGHTHNDPGDGDVGPNNYINYPEVTSSVGSQVWGTTCGLCKVDIYQAIGDPSQPGGGGVYKGSVNAALDGTWYVDLSTLPGMTGATIYNVSFVTYGLYDGSSEMSPRPILYLPAIKR